MTTQTNAPKFRETAQTAVVRDANGITVFLRETRKGPNGETVTASILEPIVLTYDKLSDAVRAEALGYGMEVRLTRQAALSIVNGKRPSVQEKHAAIAELAAHYASGTESWTMASGGGGSLSADTRALILAVQRALGLDADAAEDAVREMTTAQRDALRVDDEIKPHLDAIYAERAKAAQGSTDSLKEKLRALRA